MTDCRTYPEFRGGQKPRGGFGAGHVRGVRRKQKLWLHLCFISIWKQQEGGDTACVCVCACRITVEAKYMGLYLLTLLIIGEGSSHTQSNSRRRSSRAPWPLHHALAIRSISNPGSTRRSLCRVPFGSSKWQLMVTGSTIPQQSLIPCALPPL